METTNDQYRKSLESLERPQLIEIILGQSEEIAQLRAQVAALTHRLQELENQPPRSTAPFRIAEEKRSQAPQKPGQKKGHPGHYRQAPEVTEAIAVSLETCPRCGEAVQEVTPVEQIIEEIPPTQLRVVKLTTFEGRCLRCGIVRSTHPLPVSTAVGAAGVHLGPNALAVMTRLQHQWPLSKRKTAQILQELLGLSITPGGIVAATHRLAQRLARDYEALRQQARQAAVLHSDETSWSVGKPGYTLWVFTHQTMTCYRVVSSRSRAELHNTLGADFAGVLVTDCLSIYDDATALQHKCYSHHLQAISKAIKLHPQQGAGFLCEVKTALKSAMVLKTIQPQSHPEFFAQRRQHLQLWMDQLLASPRGDPHEETVRLRLLKQKDHLLTFLDYPGVDATNNLAERQLRPAVIARKLSCGNRTEKGARTWEVMASLATTATQGGKSLQTLIQNALLNALQPQVAR